MNLLQRRHSVSIRSNAASRSSDATAGIASGLLHLHRGHAATASAIRNSAGPAVLAGQQGTVTCYSGGLNGLHQYLRERGEAAGQDR